MGHAKLMSDYNHMGSSMSEKVGRLLYDGIKENKELCESYGVTFREESNKMANSPELFTQVLAKAIFYKSYDDFQKYFEIVWNLTPADLGLPEGAGSYKLPKIVGTQAVKLMSGEAVDYLNDNKDSVILETETFGIGTRINRRLLKRGAKGFIEKLMTAASDAVLRGVSQDLINGMVAGAASANTVGGGVTYDAIEEAKFNIRDAKNSEGVLFGFTPNWIAFSSKGWQILATSTDFKSLVQFGQRNVPGSEVANQYQVFNGLKTMTAELISVQKGGNDVHALVLDKDNYAAHLIEQDMETFDGRLPGTAGDKEIIHAMDAGSMILNAEAAAVITA